MGDEELGDFLTRGEVINTWLNAIRKEATIRIGNGQKIKGWKVVEKRAHRQFTDDAAVEGLLSLCLHNELELDFFYEAPKLMTPAAAERKCKREGLNPKILNPLIHTPSTGVTIVPESDKRPEIKAGAQSVFDALPAPEDEA
jgi:hypothetical protein